MSFVSFSFALLYLAALLFRIATRSGGAAYVCGLLALSWIFYAWHVPAYIFLLLFSTGVDYAAARWIDAAPAAAVVRRRGILIVSLLLNLGVLAYFKYGGFLLDNLAALFGEAPWTTREIVLPIGISFYTFQSMSYTIDVYRGHIAAERSFVRMACYVAFFPQLVAGPIVRAGDFLYQLERHRPLRLAVFGEGAYLILRGLFLKVVVADNLGRIVDAHWAGAARAEEGGGAVALSLLVFFSCQLFCDFAGYTEIARGVAYQLGFRLPVNFDAPYLATTFRDFWRRWHITLSTWFRDYVYIPLGGSRGGRVRALVNLLCVMLVAGLWHGASWTFVLWGAVHGTAVALERVLGFERGLRTRLGAAVWYLAVQLTWIASMGLFRAGNAADGWRMIRRAATGLTALWGAADHPIPAEVVAAWWFVVPVATLHLRRLADRHYGVAPHRYERALYAGAMLAAIATLYTTSRQFIYFQF
jgi:alginate O-acetyltransferase complex protein AlgI